MRFSQIVAAAIGALTAPAAASNSKAVFAHFIVGNVLSTYDVAKWQADVEAAKASGLTGFVLNMAPPYDDTLRNQLTNAFAAAKNVGGFENILSFDYLGGGIKWDSGDVISALQTYGADAAYFQYNNKPLVTTFEGTENIGDWSGIKAAVDVFFVPDWTSLGPAGAASHGDVIDGAFSWDMWPEGPNDMTSSPDHSWKNALGDGKAYMMGVSPWFYTDLPQWNKAWVWRGDSMWADRWNQVQEIQPDFIQVVTWNDFGESHYVGPIRDGTLPPGSDAYVNGMSHQHWRDLLPYYINRYLTGQETIDKEKLVWWYRLAPGAAGSTDATGNNCPSAINIYGYQTCYAPSAIVQDKVFFDVLLSEAPATVTVQIGDNTPVTYQATSTGVNHFTQDFNGQFGNVTFTVKRGDTEVLVGEGYAILESPPNGVANFNSYVGGVPDVYAQQ